MCMLSIIIPVFNEGLTLPTLLAQVLALPIDMEVLVIDDASTDGTQEYLEEISDHRVTVTAGDVMMLTTLRSRVGPFG